MTKTKKLKLVNTQQHGPCLAPGNINPPEYIMTHGVDAWYQEFARINNMDLRRRTDSNGNIEYGFRRTVH